MHALIGDRVIIHAGTRIGQDGFGYLPGAGGHGKVPQVGRVIIQDDVEIGANTTIDRGAIRDTVIGEGTKIDNLVQIAHNVEIGRHCVLVAHTGISGSCTIGDYVMMGGRVGIADNVTIGDGAMIGAAAASCRHSRRREVGRRAGPAGARVASRAGRGAAQACARRGHSQGRRGRRMTRHDASKPPASKEILEALPHRYPFLMVDRIIEMSGDESAIGIKNVTFNEPQFMGHFPGNPVFPGVLMIEGMAQTAGVMCIASGVVGKAEGGLFPDHRQGQIPQAGRAGRHRRISHDEEGAAQEHVVVPRRGQGRAAKSSPRPKSARC